MNKPSPLIEKARLLCQMERQRSDLAFAKQHWLDATVKVDNACLKIAYMRKYLLVASSAVAVYSIRHPSTFIRWSRRVFGIWGTVRLFRRTFLKS